MKRATFKTAEGLVQRLFMAALAAITLSAVALPAGQSVVNAAGSSGVSTSAIDPNDPTTKNLQTTPVVPPPPKLDTFTVGTLPQGVKAPKKLPTQVSANSKTQGAMTALSGCSPTCYYWAGGDQSFTGTLPGGIFANVSTNPSPMPVLKTGDSHTLVEVAARKTTGTVKQTVELGLTIDPAVNSGDSTNFHIFSFWWKNDVGICYNGCGFVPYPGATYTVGQLVGSSITSFKLGIQYDSASDAWWLWVGNTGGTVGGWIGYYPRSLWTNTNSYGTGVAGFTNNDYATGFGEIAANTSTAATTCTDMGSQVLATSTAGSSVGSFSYPGYTTAQVNVATYVAPSGINSYYNSVPLGTAGNIRTLRYGGPGGC